MSSVVASLSNGDSPQKEDSVALQEGNAARLSSEEARGSDSPDSYDAEFGDSDLQELHALRWGVTPSYGTEFGDSGMSQSACGVQPYSRTQRRLGRLRYHWKRLAEKIKLHEEQTQYGWLFEPGFSVWRQQRSYTYRYVERPSHNRSGPLPTQLVRTKAKESLRSKRYKQLTIADKLKLRPQPLRGGWTSRKQDGEYIEHTGQRHSASDEEDYNTIRNCRAEMLGFLPGSDDFFEPGSKVMVRGSGRSWHIATVIEYVLEHSHILVNYDGVPKDCSYQNCYYSMFPSWDPDSKDGNIKHVPRTQKFIDMLDNLTHKQIKNGFKYKDGEFVYDDTY